MTGPVTVGDLIDAARLHLDRAGKIPGRPGDGRELVDVICGMHALAVAIGRCLRDGAASPGPVLRDPRDRFSPWPAACLRARRAAANAARSLQPPAISRWVWVPATGRGRQLVRRLPELVDLARIQRVGDRDRSRLGGDHAGSEGEGAEIRSVISRSWRQLLALSLPHTLGPGDRPVSFGTYK